MHPQVQPRDSAARRAPEWDERAVRSQAEQVLAALAGDWIVLRDVGLPPAQPRQPPACMPFVLLHPELGAVLLEFEPAATPDAEHRFLERLHAARMAEADLAKLPVLCLRIAPVQIGRLERALEHALARRLARGAVPDLALVRRVRRALRGAPVVGARPRRGPVPPLIGVLRSVPGRAVAVALGAIGCGAVLLQLLPGAPAGNGATGRAEPHAHRPLRRAGKLAQPPIGRGEAALGHGPRRRAVAPRRGGICSKHRA
jgi:hypothetical protein